MTSKSALRLWREKLEFLRSERAIASSALVQFELDQKIEECLEKIREENSDTLSLSPVIPSGESNSNKVELKSERGIDYTKLRDLLEQQKWKEADEETGRVMREAAGVEEDLGWLDEESINNFPCEDLCTIDSLWKCYSNEKFGFSIQKEIYDRLKETQKNDRDMWGNFCDCVVWRRGKKWLSGSDLTFKLTAAPRGHLPSFFGNPFVTLNMDSCAYFFCCLMQKIESCYNNTDYEF